MVLLFSPFHSVSSLKLFSNPWDVRYHIFLFALHGCRHCVRPNKMIRVYLKEIGEGWYDIYIDVNYEDSKTSFTLRVNHEQLKDIRSMVSDTKETLCVRGSWHTDFSLFKSITSTLQDMIEVYLTSIYGKVTLMIPLDVFAVGINGKVNK